MDPYLDILGKRIRAMRRELGMSQEGLAHEAGLDRSYVGSDRARRTQPDVRVSGQDMPGNGV